MRNCWAGLVESRLPSSRCPGFVRQVSGVIVAGGRGEGVKVGERVGVNEMGVDVESGGSAVEQAATVTKSINKTKILLIA